MGIHDVKKENINAEGQVQGNGQKKRRILSAPVSAFESQSTSQQRQPP